jgi:hypothetical protein
MTILADQHAVEENVGGKSKYRDIVEIDGLRGVASLRQ